MPIIFSHFGRFWRGVYFFSGHFGRFRRAVYLLFSAILAVFGGRYIHYFRPVWPFSDGGRFIFLGRFWPFLEGGRFIIFSHIGCFRRVVYSFFSAIWAVFGGRYIHYFGSFFAFFGGRYTYHFRPFWL